MLHCEEELDHCESVPPVTILDVLQESAHEVINIDAVRDFNDLFALCEPKWYIDFPAEPTVIAKTPFVTASLVEACPHLPQVYMTVPECVIPLPDYVPPVHGPVKPVHPVNTARTPVDTAPTSVDTALVYAKSSPRAPARREPRIRSARLHVSENRREHRSYVQTLRDLKDLFHKMSFFKNVTKDAGLQQAECYFILLDSPHPKDQVKFMLREDGCVKWDGKVYANPWTFYDQFKKSYHVANKSWWHAFRHDMLSFRNVLEQLKTLNSKS